MTGRERGETSSAMEALRAHEVPLQARVGAVSFLVAGVEFVSLANGQLFRVCARDEAEIYFPYVNGIPERPLRMVQLVDAPVGATRSVPDGWQRSVR